MDHFDEDDELVHLQAQTGANMHNHTNGRGSVTSNLGVGETATPLRNDSAQQVSWDSLNINVGDDEEESYGVGDGEEGNRRMHNIQIANSNGDIVGDHIPNNMLDLNTAFSHFGGASINRRDSLLSGRTIESFLHNYHRECQRHERQHVGTHYQSCNRNVRSHRRRHGNDQRRRHEGAPGTRAGQYSDEENQDENLSADINGVRQKLLRRMQMQVERQRAEREKAATDNSNDDSGEDGQSGEEDTNDSLESLDESRTESTADPRGGSTVSEILSDENKQRQREAVEDYRKMLMRSNIDPDYYFENFCPLCGFSNNSTDPIVAEDWNGIKKIIEENIFEMSEETHAILVSIFWTERIFLPMREQGMRCMPLDVDMARDHIYSPHKLDMRVIQGNAVKKMKRMSNVLENNIFSQHSLTGQLEVKTKNLEKYLQVVQSMIKVGSVDPTKTPFNANKDSNVGKSAGATVSSLRSLKRPNPAATVKHSRKRPRSQT